MATKPKAATAAKSTAKPEAPKGFVTTVPATGTDVAVIRAADFIDAVNMLKRIPMKTTLFARFAECYLLRFIAKSAKESARWIAVASDGHVLAEDSYPATDNAKVNKSATWIVDAEWMNGALRFIHSLKLDKTAQITFRVAADSRMEIVAGDCSFIAPAGKYVYPFYDKVFDQAKEGTPSLPLSFDIALLGKLSVDGKVRLKPYNISEGGECCLFIVENITEIRGMTRRAALMPIRGAS